MNRRGFLFLFGLIVLMLAVGLACGSPTPTEEPPTAEPRVEPTVAPPTAVPTAPPTEAAAAVAPPSASEWVTFTDESDLLEIEVPGDWEYSQTSDTDNDFWYWDVFTSPDGHAQIDSIVYDDGEPFVGTQSGKTALQWLHQNYSNTGQEGDIRISEDSMQKDGSERLVWESKGGDYSGISFFEIRKPTAMLMFTVWWDNDYEDEYLDLLNEVVASYRVP